MDAIDINQAANKVMKRLTNSGQVGRTEPAKVFTFDGDTTGKETYSNMVKVSDEILDLSQITKIAVYAVEADVSEEMSTADLKLLEGDGCAFLMTPDGGVTFVASYSVKKDDFTPGIYVIATENAYVSRIEFSETIHPIDPKYLPGVCLPVVVDFDELGLTTAILSLLNDGGGELSLNSVDGGEAVSEAMCKAIPLDRSYIAKLTVSGMGVMNVTPIYTLKDDYGFKAAHFDSYTENNGALTKFYVRLYRSTNNANYNAGMIRVGFY